MKTRRLVLFGIVTTVIASVAAGGVALARQTHEARLGKKIARALTKAGVDEARVESILGQLRQHRAELVSAVQQRRAALEGIAALSPGQPAELSAQVEALLGRQQQNRERLRAVVEQVGAQLSAREKAQLVLNLADRFAHFQGVECGSRLERLVEHLEDGELLGAAEIDAVEARLQQATPQMCGFRDALRSDVAALRAVVAKDGASDADIEAILGRMKQNRTAAAEARIDTLRQVIAELSPETQIEIAGKLARLHRAAELFLRL